MKKLNSLWKLSALYTPVFACAAASFFVYQFIEGAGFLMPYTLIYIYTVVSTIDFRKTFTKVSVGGKEFTRLIGLAAGMAGLITASFFMEDVRMRVANVLMVAVANYFFVKTLQSAKSK